MKRLSLFCSLSLFLLVVSSVFAQDYSYHRFKEHRDQYEQPLKTVLADMEKDLGVKIVWDKKFEPFLDAKVALAPWKLWNDPQIRLAYILAPLDLSFEKTDAHTYRVFEPWYYIRPELEGKAHLDRILKQFPNKAAWELRRQNVCKAILKTLDLDPLPRQNPQNLITTEKRLHDGYTVQNIALEVFPKYYVCATLYEPIKKKGPFPLVLCPHGHGKAGRTGNDQQYRSATLARMGAVVVTYSMFAWLESESPLLHTDHRDPISGTMQTLATIRYLDYMLANKNIDRTRVGITGCSGGGTQTFLGTALDNRITVSVPVVMASSHFFGGCPCESGLPFHTLCGGTCNAEIACFAAPRPMKLIAVTQDWTKNTPTVEFPFAQKVYGYFNAVDKVEYAIFDEPHNYGPSKRQAMYPFMAKHLGLDIKQADESKVTLETAEALMVFGPNKERYPKNGVKNIEELIQAFHAAK
ncbi:MAG: hypothetical protein PHQ75_05940 [Thermoguttaceae bacterium]|nr:hypothetical protein [Thermoguttaceae bacterium]